MKILEQLTSLKKNLKDIEIAVNSLPQEIQQEFSDKLTDARNALTAAGDIVDKYFSDEKTFEAMTKDLLSRLNGIPIYEGLSDQIKASIVDKIIRSKDLNLLDENDLKVFIEDRLETSSIDDLLKKAYSKYDILKLGEAVEKSRSVSVSKKYESGLNVLRGLVATPKGRQEAIAHGVERLMKDLMSRRYYISLYYGLTRTT